MNKVQKKALKARVKQNLKFQKNEYKKLKSIASRLGMRSDKLFKTAFSQVRKDITLYKRINKKIR